jgi:hypothetical protein
VRTVAEILVACIRAGDVPSTDEISRKILRHYGVGSGTST